MATDKDVTRIIGVMVHAFPKYEISQETMKMYIRMLSDIPCDALEAAAKQIIADNKFFPMIAELRETARRLMIGSQNIPSAFEAWENALEQIRRCGDYYRYTICEHEPEYKHPLVKRAVEIMGYRNLMESDNPVADRAHFFKVYESLLSRAEEDMRLLPESRAVTNKYIADGTKKLLARFTVNHD